MKVVVYFNNKKNNRKLKKDNFSTNVSVTGATECYGYGRYDDETGTEYFGCSGFGTGNGIKDSSNSSGYFIKEKYFGGKK